MKSEALTIAKGTRLFIIDDEGVLFSPTSHVLYGLNPSAVFIWCQLETGADVDAIVLALRQTFSAGREEAERHVRDVLATWEDLGLVGVGGAPACSASLPRVHPDAAGSEHALPAYRRAAVQSEIRVRLLDTCALVRFSSAEQAHWVTPVLAHLTEGGRSPAITIDILEDTSGLLVYCDGEPQCRVHDIRGLAPRVKGTLLRSAVNRHRYFLFLHSGVVFDGRRCMLLSGAAGSGKSTLTAGLLAAGFVYFSDEVALLEGRELRVRPVPLALSIKSSGWDVIAPYHPQIRELPVHRREDGKLIRYLPPPGPIEAPDMASPVGRLVFPRYEPSAETSLRPLARVEALRRVIGECLAIPADLDEERVEQLVLWIRSIDSFELSMSALQPAMDALRSPA